jgi:hypothetical protein
MKDFNFAREDYPLVIDELLILAEKNNEEVSFRDYELKVNTNAYQTLYDNNSLGIYTLRDKESTLIGYLTVIVSEDLHYQKIFGVCDSLFIEKEFRKGLLAAKFIKFAKEDVFSLKVDEFFISSTVSNPIDGLLEKLGFDSIEKKYSMKRPENGN